MTWEEYRAVRGLEGYRYELIDGRLSVFPPPNLSHSRVWKWAYGKLDAYSESRPDIINYVISGSAVFVEERPGDTAPEPDIAAYRGFPLDAELDGISWDSVSPILVVEILSPDNAHKDLERNVELYLAVPSISEYWIFDPRDGLANTTMRVYRRRGQRWQRPIALGPGDTYTTKLLPGFSLVIDPLA